MARSPKRLCPADGKRNRQRRTDENCRWPWEHQALELRAGRATGAMNADSGQNGVPSKPTTGGSFTTKSSMQSDVLLTAEMPARSRNFGKPSGSIHSARLAIARRRTRGQA